MEREILNVKSDEELYSISCDEGVSVAEVMFAMAVAIKIMVRDGIIESPIAAEALLHKYLTDPQYDELHAEEVEETTEA